MYRLFLLLFTFFLTSCGDQPPSGQPVPLDKPPRLAVGDHWVYNKVNGYNNEIADILSYDIIRVEKDAITFKVKSDFRTGARAVQETYTPGGNLLIKETLDTGAFRYQPYYPSYRFPLEAGQTWREDFSYLDSRLNRRVTAQVYARAIRWERIRVPAGEFNTLRISRDIYFNDQEWWRSGTTMTETDWYSPEVKRFVLHTDYFEYLDFTQGRRNALVRGDRNELHLTEYRLSGTP